MFSIEPTLRKTWYVVFEPATKKRWFHRFLKPDFTHCYCMTRSDGGAFWIVVDPRWEFFRIDYRAVSTFPEVTDYTGEHAVVVEYESIIRPGTSSVQLCVSSCVDIVKRCLGIKSYRIWTPYQLYRRVQRGRHV